MEQEVYFKRNPDGGYGPPEGFTIAPGASTPGGQFANKYIGPDGRVYNTFYGSSNNPAEGNSPFSRLIPEGATPGAIPALTESSRPLQVGESFSTPGVVTPIVPGGPQVNYGQGPQPFTGNFNPPALPTRTPVEGQYTPTYQPLTEPIKVPSVQGASSIMPPLPLVTAPTTYQSYMDSNTQELANVRKTLEDSYKKQIDDLNKQIETSQNLIAGFVNQQKGIIENQAQPLVQPFRETLENAQRESLYITKNFENNQTLVNELESLLTEGNTLIEQQKGMTGLAAIRTPTINKTIENVAARVGVIKAVMAARTGQIAEAYNMIDRSITAITADRKDKLDYYNTLLKFYDTQRDTEGKKLIELTKNERTYLDAQVALLQTDLTNSQTYAESIKKAMSDPDKADAYAMSGVSLNDSPTQIASKLSTYAYSKEVAKLSNDMAEKGYSYLIPGQKAPPGTETVTTTDSRGVTKQYYKKPTASTEFGAPTAESKAKAKNWLLLQPGYTQSDLAKLETDPAFFAWVLSQAQ